MTEIKIKFDLSFSRRFMTTAVAAAMMLCAVPELDSESVTLSTYYPAPSGVYTNMITTGNTYLARDGGAVGLGTTALVGSSKLTVTGGSIAGAYALTPQYQGWANYGTGDGGAAIYNDAGTYQGLMVVGNNSGGGGVRRVKVWDELTVNGNEVVTGAATFGGSLKTTAGSACADVSYNYPTPGGGTVALCGGQYVTAVDGFYTKKYVLAGVVFQNTNPTVTARCCPCPPSGCTL